MGESDARRNEAARHWPLDPEIAFLNHGSFGACPIPVLEAQRRWRDRMERQPVQFFVRDLEGLLDEAREALARFVGADATGMAWVPNTTAGVNAVLRSMRLGAGEELLTTDHEYNACRNALEYVAKCAGARVVVATLPFPVTTEDAIVGAVLDRVGPRTRLALIDHITSQTGWILPIERLARELAERGVELLVDGSHAPGMLDLDVGAVGAAYYTGNCHKWLCAPKGAGFLCVREDLRQEVRPTSIGHGASSTRSDRSRFLQEFDWPGTDDPSVFLAVPEAIRFMGSLLPGGWPAVREHNRCLALEARRKLAEALEVPLPCPDAMIGSIASLPLPDGSPEPPRSPLYADPLQDRLLDEWGIEVPVIPWPAPPRRLVRISAQVYNRAEHYDKLATALRSLLRDAPSQASGS